MWHLSYTELGQPLEYHLGADSAWVMDLYDQQTNRLTEQWTSAGDSVVTVGDLHYGYDDVGNVTSESDMAAGDYQCFRYDYLGRLADAWAQGASGCAPSPSASALGGPSPYWQHLAYDAAGNIASDDWTYDSTGSSYLNYTNTYGAAQPHTMTSQKVVSSADGSWTNNDSYDGAGNLTARQTPPPPSGWPGTTRASSPRLATAPATPPTTCTTPREICCCGPARDRPRCTSPMRSWCSTPPKER